MEHEERGRGPKQTGPATIFESESQSLDRRAVSSDPEDRNRPPQLTWPRETRSKHEKALAASATPGTEYWLP